MVLPLASWLCKAVGPVRALQLGTATLFLSQVVSASATGPAFLFVARAMQGSAGGVMLTAGFALIAGIFPADQRGRALGTAMGGMSLGTLFGPPLGGWLYTWGGPRFPFLVSAVWTLALGLVLLWLPVRLALDQRDKGRRLTLVGFTNYLPVFIAVVLGISFLSGLELTLPVHLNEQLHAAPSQIGMLFGLASLVYGLSAPLAGWAADRWGGRPTIVWGLGASILVLPAIALPVSWGAEAVVLGLFAVACAFLIAPTLPEIAAVCESGHGASFGAAYAVFNFADALGMLIGPVAGGALKPILGFPFTLGIFSGVAALLFPLLLLHSRRQQGNAADGSPAGATEQQAA
jgi:MFS family permease